MSRIVCRITDALGSTLAIVLVPIICVVALRWVGDNAITYALSVASLTICQLVLRAGDADTRALQAKLDSLILAIDGADNRLVGIERKV